jgi:hypothetical protein
VYTLPQRVHLRLRLSAAPPSPDEFDEFAYADAHHEARLWADEQTQDTDHAERLRCAQQHLVHIRCADIRCVSQHQKKG